MAPACPPPKIFNVFELSQGDHAQENLLSSQFDLTRIDIRYYTIKPGDVAQIKVDARTMHFAFVIKGSGSLELGSKKGDLKEWDCFGFPSLANDELYSVNGGNDGLSLIVYKDTKAFDGPVSENSSQGFPAIVHALSVTKPSSWKGRFFCHAAALTKLCQCNSPDPTKDNRWNVALAIVPPGSKTSHAHAHSLEDELAIMLKGEARYWHHGTDPSPILKPGDCVGWKAATGIAHNLINDGEGPNDEGKPFYYLIWGDCMEGDDQCFYPDRSDNGQPDHHRWVTKPDIAWGSASKEPKFPKPDDYNE